MVKKCEYFVETNGSSVKASEYQCKIFDAIEHKTCNLVVNAAAGSSKTTTIVNSLRFIPSDKKILFVAFNKDIVKKIKTCVSHQNTNIMTFHGLGYYLLLENGLVKKSDSFINEDKYKQYIRKNLSSLTSNTNKQILKKNHTSFIKNLIKLCDYARYYLAFTEKEIKKVSSLYDLTLFDNETEICKKILSWGKEDINEIDYTDLLWLPNVLNLTTKKYTYNWIFVDEAQDTNIAEQELIKKCFKRGTRFAVVCDEFQQINVWAGSTLKAIENFKNFPNTKEYKLPISYRCPKKIVELARNYSDNIVATDNAIDGEVNYDVPYTAPISEDMVLCRMTSPLIQLYLKYLKLNKKSFIRGFENLKDEYLSIINQYESKIIDKECFTSDGLFSKIFKHFIEKIKIVENNYSISFDEAIMHNSVLSEYDTIEGLKILSEGLVTVDELVDRISTIFSDNNNDGICLSTVHKAKGLECDNVYILYPSLFKRRKNEKEWEKQTENNLIYVAYTRARKSLNFIKEERNNRFLFSNEQNLKLMKEYINTYYSKIKFNTENKISEKNLDCVVNNSKKINVLGETKTKTEGNLNTKNKKSPLGRFKNL